MTSDRARDEEFTAALALVVEEKTRAYEHAVCFAIILREIVRVSLCAAIGAAGPERRRFTLRRRSLAKDLTRRSLVDAGLFDETCEPDRFEDVERTTAVNLEGVLRQVERITYVALRGEIVDLVRRNFRNDVSEAQAVGHVTKVEVDRLLFGEVRNAPLAGFGTRASDDAVDFIVHREQEFSEVGAILSGDAGNEGDFLGHVKLLVKERYYRRKHLFDVYVTCGNFYN